MTTRRLPPKEALLHHIPSRPCGPSHLPPTPSNQYSRPTGEINTPSVRRLRRRPPPPEGEEDHGSRRSRPQPSQHEPPGRKRHANGVERRFAPEQGANQSGTGRAPVEVRGVEPRSSEASAPASPSAADSEHLGRAGRCRHETLRPSRSWSYPAGPGSRRGQPSKVTPVLPVRAPDRRTGYLIRQPVRGCPRHLWLFPVW